MTNRLFFDQYDLDPAKTQPLIEAALQGTDDGELYLQYAQSESITFDDNRVKSSSYNTTKGFGLRAVCGEAVGYAHSGILTHEEIKKAASTLGAVKDGYDGKLALAPNNSNAHYYEGGNPLGGVTYAEKVKLLEDINAYARAKSDKIRQVSVNLSGEWEVVTILRPDGHMVTDERPMIRFVCVIITSDGTAQEMGFRGRAGRFGYGEVFDNWQTYVDMAVDQALLKLDAKPAPAGVMPVVLGAGEPGVILHEAVGHGLEGDFNRKKTSAFHNKMGQMVAAKGVTVVDNGTIPNGMGTINYDDEGTPAQNNVLIEDGKLVGFMQDRQNARLMGMQPTGNGRRETYECLPMPRMTNTYMENGEYDKEDLFKGIKRGLYAVDMSGGQVDITSGKYVFSVTEAYMIEDGKITTPVKGATLVGDGPSDLLRIKKVANDLELDLGAGACGKNGQSIPVHVGQPSVLIDNMTVGGTEG